MPVSWPSPSRFPIWFYGIRKRIMVPTVPLFTLQKAEITIPAIYLCRKIKPFSIYKGLFTFPPSYLLIRMFGFCHFIFIISARRKMPVKSFFSRHTPARFFTSGTVICAEVILLCVLSLSILSHSVRSGRP